MASLASPPTVDADDPNAVPARFALRGASPNPFNPTTTIRYDLPEAGRIVLDRRPFDLRESLGDTMKSLAVRAHTNGLEVASRFAPDVPDHLIGDVGRLRQIIVNLVGNGIKFTEEGEVVLEGDCESRADDEAMLEEERRLFYVALTRAKLAWTTSQSWRRGLWNMSSLPGRARQPVRGLRHRCSQINSLRNFAQP